MCKSTNICTNISHAMQIYSGVGLQDYISLIYQHLNKLVFCVYGLLIGNVTSMS